MQTAALRQTAADAQDAPARAALGAPPRSGPLPAAGMRREQPFGAHGDARRSLAWTVFALVLLTHAGAGLVLRDYLARKHRITPPEPIIVTLVDAGPQQSAAADAPGPSPLPSPAPQMAPARQPRPPDPPREIPAPEPVQAPVEPVARPLEPLPPPPPPPPPRPEPASPEPMISELPPPPAPPAEVAPPARPAPSAGAPAPAIAKPSAPPGPAGPRPATAASSGAPGTAASETSTPPRFNAAYLDNPKPAYPLSARRMQLEGTVRLRVFVNAAGSVEEVEVQQTSGTPALDRSALDAVKQWRFVPARQDDRAVPAWVIVPIVFTLKG